MCNRCNEDDQVEFKTSEYYEPEEDGSHYVKLFNIDDIGRDLTLLIRDDQWETSDRTGTDYLAFRTAAVAITREDAVKLAKWVLERFDV